MGSQPQKTLSEVQEIIGRVKFMDRTFHVEERAGGFMIQVQYMELDVDDPEARGPTLQKARKWYVSSFSTDTEIVETAFAACRRSMDHVLKEHFTYKGRRVYSPHFDVEARVRMCDEGAFDGRIPPR